MTTVQKVVISTLLAFSIGLQWPLLQSVAWINMFLTFSQSSDVKTALVKTFDGKNPCNVCRLVQDGQKSEENTGRDQAKVIKKLEPPLKGTSNHFIFPQVLHGKTTDEFILYLGLSYPPSFPPPKTA